MKYLVCLLENRPDDAIGAYLTAESLRRFEPDLPIHINGVLASGASPKLQNDPLTEFDPNSPEGAESWNCKPHTIIPLLEKHGGRVTWIDSDIIISGPITPILDGLDDETAVVAREPLHAPTVQGCSPRARGWGFPIGREIPYTINSCVLSFTRKHLPLLKRWHEILSSDVYRAHQHSPLTERPMHSWSDQDVLCALLASEEFSKVPLHTLALGDELIHVGHALSYDAGERLKNIFGLPPFVHSGAARPWSHYFFAVSGGQGLLRRVNRDLSPYTALAQEYTSSYPEVAKWRTDQTLLGKIIRTLCLNNCALAGLPVWVAAAIAQKAVRILKRKRS